jgi:hypothetical protein
MVLCEWCVIYIRLCHEDYGNLTQLGTDAVYNNLIYYKPWLTIDHESLGCEITYKKITGLLHKQPELSKENGSFWTYIAWYEHTLLALLVL